MHRTPILFALLASPALAGNVLVVGPSPAPYVRIQDAIADASSGDIILVKAGTYNSMRIHTKALTIVAENNAAVLEYSGARIDNLKLRQTVVISGIACTGRYDATVPEIQRGLWARNNLGQILALDSSFTGYHDLTICANFAAPAGVDVEQCAGVSIVGGTIRGAKNDQYTGVLPQAPGGIMQGPGLRVGSNAKVSCDQLQIYGEEHGVNCFYDFDWGGAGAKFEGSFAQGFFSGCALKGGSGSSVTLPCTHSNPYAGYPQPGLVVTGSSNVVALLWTNCTGGLGATHDCWGLTMPPPTPNAPPISGVVSNIAGTPRSLRAPRLVRETQTPAFVFVGASGESVELAVTLDGLIHTLDSAQSGVAHIANPHWRPVGTVPANGILSVSFPLPQLTPQDPGRTWFCQARFTDTTSGARRLSNAWALVEVDSAY